MENSLDKELCDFGVELLEVYHDAAQDQSAYDLQPPWLATANLLQYKCGTALGSYSKFTLAQNIMPSF